MTLSIRQGAAALSRKSLGISGRSVWHPPCLPRNMLWLSEAITSPRMGASQLAQWCEWPCFIELRAGSMPRVHRPRGRLAPWATVVLGRATKCDIRIDSRSVSRVHAVVERHPRTAELVLIDQSSRRGTWVDGLRVRAGDIVDLKLGALLRFGAIQFLYARPRLAHAIMQRAVWNRGESVH